MRTAMAIESSKYVSLQNLPESAKMSHTLPPIHSQPITPPDSGNTGEAKDDFENVKEDDGTPHEALISYNDRDCHASNVRLFRQGSQHGSSQKEISSTEESTVGAGKLQKLLLTRVAEARKLSSRYQWDEKEFNIKRPTRDDCKLAGWFQNAFPVQAERYFLDVRRENQGQWDRSYKEEDVSARKRKRTDETGSRRKAPKVIAPKTPKAAPKVESSSGERRVRAATQGPNGESKPTQKKPPEKPAMSDNYQDYADYSPNFSALEGPNKEALYLITQLKKAGRYSGGAKAAPNKPDVAHLLHPAELDLASALALTPNRFLVTKRQIFTGYVKNFLEPSIYTKKTWNKTAAQQNANVDVGKTSFMWRFYRRIGAWKASHFQQFIESHTLPLALDAAKDDDDK